jgi:hypothetical protein
MDRQEILKKLEEEVSVIKDPELKKIAFGKMLDKDIGLTKKKQKGKTKVTGDKTKKGTRKIGATMYYSMDKVREEVQKLNITGKLKGLIPYKSCKEEWERYLWVLAAAKKLKIVGLNNHEIAFILSKRLYRKTKYSSVNNIHKKVGIGLVHSDPDTNLWLITPDGEEYLANLDKAKNSKIDK